MAGVKSLRKLRWTPEIVRGRIRAQMIVRKLQAHLLGKLELSGTQLRAADILLRKVLPDQTHVEHSGTLTQRAEELPDAVLADIATGSGEGIAETQDSQEIPSGIH